MKNNNRYSLIKWFINNPKALGLIVFTILSFLFIYIAYQNYLLSKEDKRVEMTNTLNVITNNIDQTLKNCYTTTLSLALIIDEDGVPQDFNTIGQRLLESNSNIDAVQMVPNGIIKYVYPLQGNESVIGLDILNSKVFQEEALKSIQTQKMYFAGPFELTQGGQGIVGRLPVYLKNKFWGFSAVIIKMDRMLLSSGINTLNTKNFYLQLSKINPNTKKEEFFLPERIKLTENNHISSFISDGDWKLSIIDKNSNVLLQQFILKSIIALLVAYTLCFFTVLLLRRPKELESLVEEQANKLISTELKFKAIFEQAAVSIVYADGNTGKFIEVNEKFCKLLGYTEKELKETTFHSITHPNDLKEDLKNLIYAKDGMINNFSVEKRYLTKKGEIIWAILTVTPFIDNQTDLKKTNLIAIIEDITERKQNEMLIINSQQRIESLINTIDGIVWEFDLETEKFTFVSKKVEDILGFTAEEWLASHTFWTDHIFEEDKEYAINLCLDKTSKNLDHDFEYRMLNKQGEIVWLRDIVNVISKDNNPLKLRGIMIDITKNKEIEKDLNTSFNLLTAQNKRLLNFSYIVSHNLRSHTSNISSLIGLIDSAENNDEKQEMFELLKSVSSSLNDTLSNLNEVVNIQTNKSLTIEKINLFDCIQNTLFVFSKQIKLNDITINNLIKEDLEINYNAAYIESIVYNLISNAIRYADKERNPLITIKFYNENDLSVLEIADNGIGIDLEKNQNKIFGMYKTFSDNKDSKGIGLFITKNQVEAMGGTITVTSEPNVGTTFKIYMV